MGGILRWNWVRNIPFRIIHGIAVIFVAVEALVGVLCPLTEWEHRLREMAGKTVERDLTFVAQLVRRVVFYDFPPWVFTLMYIGFGVLVVLTFIFIPPKRKKRKV